jgi:hypothetical protein
MGGFFPRRPGVDDSLQRALQSLIDSTPPQPFEIGKAGERIVVKDLQAAHYSGDWDTRAPGSTDIEAWGPTHLLVQVKTGLYPNDPPSLSPSEERNIKARAARLNAEAWEAKVQIMADLTQVGKIQWRRLRLL